MLVTCFSTAAGVTTSMLGDPPVRAALAHQLEHLALARRERVERVLAAPAPEHPRDDVGVERGAALGHPAHRVGERGEVGDAVLEEVADALGAVADQVERVALVGVLGEHEDADVRLARADLDRRAQAVVGVVGRHLDVDDRDVGLVRGDLAHEVDGVAGLAGDLEARVLEQPDDALAQQGLVLADDDAHGRTAQSMRPAAGGPRRSIRRGEPRSDFGRKPRAPQASTALPRAAARPWRRARPRGPGGRGRSS